MIERLLTHSCPIVRYLAKKQINGENPSIVVGPGKAFDMDLAYPVWIRLNLNNFFIDEYVIMFNLIGNPSRGAVAIDDYFNVKSYLMLNYPI